MLIVSCDPGLTGAIALICSQRGLLDCVDIPTEGNGLATGGMKRWVDVRALETVLTGWSVAHEFAAEEVQSVIERPIPMPSMPSTTTASSFDTFGVLRAVLGRRGRVTCVAPAAWKRLYAFGKDKSEARACCLRLYPTAPVHRVKDHNRAEAILVGHWLLKELA